MSIKDLPRDMLVRDLKQSVKADWLKFKPGLVKFRGRFLDYREQAS
ncbi:hypothetical protein [Pseudomonas guariconensis]|nr:hypothetical protein [Pseudomonas guariconensis]MBH3361380.1 hypothetical protein [Pseudomonas guariconensis]